MALRKVHQHDTADQLLIVEYVEVVAGPVVGRTHQNEMIGAHVCRGRAVADGTASQCRPSA